MNHLIKSEKKFKLIKTVKISSSFSLIIANDPNKQNKHTSTPIIIRKLAPK